jgi:prepilin-type N-terminal cleavage/methylation domain-containing protein
MESIHLLMHFLSSTCKSRMRAVARGFSLIEMIIVLSIITIILSIILVSQTTFNRTLLLTNTAYTIALSIREVQSLGLSSIKFGSSQNEGYGLHFSSGASNSYVEFGDIANSLPFPASTITWCPTGAAKTPDAKPGNCLYDGASELAQTYTFNQGYAIGAFCGHTTLDGWVCSNGSSNPISTLDIVFQRPNTNTVMTVITTNNNALQADTACIKLQTPGGASYDYIEVTQLGEVTVLPNNTSCP